MKPTPTTTRTFAAAIIAIAGLATSVLAQADAPKAIDNTDVKAKPAQAEAAKTSLSIGDKAPALSVEKFVKGAPIAGFEAGKVYVVEFWATWCGPCIKAFPHLSDLQAKYKEQGVTFVGVNVWERPYNDSTLSKVSEFVEKQGDRMAYTVAFDGKDKKTDTAWMKAAGQNGIPHAFIVNQEGVIAWAGHPMGMDEPLAKIVGKSWNIADAKAAAAKEKAEREDYEKKAKTTEAKVGPVNKKINDAIKAGKWDEAMSAMDELKALVPAAAVGRIEVNKFNTLLMRANLPERAYAMKDALLAAKGVGDNAQVLNDIAWRVLDDENVKTRNADFAFELASKANELTKGQDGAIMDTLARAYFDKGNKAKAIETQEAALKLVKADTQADPDMVKDMEESLKRYQAK